MIKYALKHERFGYFKPGNSGSLWYNDTDFVSDITKASLYVHATREISNKLLDLTNTQNGIPQLHDINQYSIVPVEITIDEKESVAAGVDILKTMIDDVKSFDLMSDEEVNALSRTDFLKFKNMRRVLKSRNLI